MVSQGYDKARVGFTDIDSHYMAKPAKRKDKIKP